jgi:hypothetical protein
MSPAPPLPGVLTTKHPQGSIFRPTGAADSCWHSGTVKQYHARVANCPYRGGRSRRAPRAPPPFLFGVRRAVPRSRVRSGALPIQERAAAPCPTCAPPPLFFGVRRVPHVSHGRRVPPEPHCRGRPAGAVPHVAWPLGLRARPSGRSFEASPAVNAIWAMQHF